MIPRDLKRELRQFESLLREAYTIIQVVGAHFDPEACDAWMRRCDELLKRSETLLKHA